ncbi:helicase-related protein [Atopobiaceae bacterium HCP3S3_D6]
MDIKSLTPGMHVAGIIPTEAVEIIAAKPSDGSVSVVFQKLDGSFDSVVLFFEDLDKVIEVAGDGVRRFDADASSFLLASEALRIRYSYAFDNRLAMHTSLIEPLPHQITAVYEDMLPRQPLRFLLADDPGAGKTIMAGLLIKELIIRGEVERCLIVCPGGLVQQWVEDELGPKFGLEFRMLTNDVVDSTRSGNPFRDIPLMVASMDKLARDERLKAMLGEVEWDLVVVDEAHKMAAHRNGRKVDATRRYRLGELLRDHTRNLLLMTATPHNGKEGDFQEFMKLLDRDRFEGGTGAGLARNTDGMMRRLQKEELLTFEGKPLFPIREARTSAYTLSAGEQSLYEHVTEYVREGFNRADRIVRQDRRNAVGFALTSLQRRLASSPMAAWKSIERRRMRLERLAREVREHGTYTVHPHGGAGKDDQFWDDWDDWDEEDIDEAQDDDTLVLDDATASETLDELESEIAELKALESEASDVYHRGEDRKWNELLRLLESEQMKRHDGNREVREKLIVFTEYTDTLEYLEGKLSSYLGSAGRLRTIRGGMNRDQRRQVEADFKQDDDVSVLVATDAAGEGINLQVAHILINYDLPWNPNRIEQRFGRIHRIGQRHTCYMYNLVADGTREGEVWHRLFQKLEQESETLHGRVFDVLGQVTYDDKTLSELLLDAIRRDSTPERQSYLDTVIDSSLDTDRLKDLMATDVLATDSLDVEDVRRVREDIERANAMRLQPHYIRSFFASAVEDLGGHMVSNGDGTYRIRKGKVPLALRVSSSGVRRPLAEGYASLAFNKDDVKEPGKTDLVCVGHPLLDAAVEEILAKHGESLGRGSILIDDANRTLAPRELLTYLLTLVDGCGQVCERRLYYVEVERGKEPVIFGQAPYIDYRPPSKEELARLDSGALDPLELGRDGEERAERVLMDGPVAHDVREISEKRAARVDKVEEAVRQRLNHAIATASTEKERWAERARSGDEGARPTAANKKRELESLMARRDTRLKELEGERMVRPKPLKLSSAAVVIPSRAITTSAEDAKELFEARKASEERGMDAVMCIERHLHHAPEDVSRRNMGWDIQSYVERLDGTGDWRFIESKGVREDADTVTLSPNEVRKAAGNSDTFVLAVTRPLGRGTRTTYYFGAVQDDYNPALDSYPYKLSMLEERAASCETYDIEDGKCTRRS